MGNGSVRAVLAYQQLRARLELRDCRSSSRKLCPIGVCDSLVEIEIEKINKHPPNDLAYCDHDISLQLTFSRQIRMRVAKVMTLLS
jgi:hypothetical protein